MGREDTHCTRTMWVERIHTAHARCGSRGYTLHTHDANPVTHALVHNTCSHMDTHTCTRTQVHSPTHVITYTYSCTPYTLTGWCFLHTGRWFYRAGPSVQSTKGDQTFYVRGLWRNHLARCEYLSMLVHTDACCDVCVNVSAY